MMNRDFKGIWIPKEIWLSKELTMIEKIILVEIDSLDNENHCIAGNEYFAEFCNCSKSAVTKAIKHLKELELIDELEFDGRHRKLSVRSRVVNFTMQNDKIYDAELQILRPNNIANKKVYNKNNSKELLETGEKKKLIQKPNLYQKCTSMILDSTQNTEFRNILFNYLTFRLEIKDKPLYANQWKGMLNKLENLHGGNIDLGIEIVQQSLDRGYLSFFPLSTKANKQPTNQNVSYYEDEEYMQEQEDWLAERRKNGQRTEY